MDEESLNALKDSEGGEGNTADFVDGELSQDKITGQLGILNIPGLLSRLWLRQPEI